MRNSAVLTIPVIPDSAPFTAEQRAWLNGYFAGVFSRTSAPDIAPLVGLNGAAAPKPLTPLTILFGSQTGTAEGLAKRAAKEAGKRGFAATVLDMAQTDAGKLATEKNVLVIVSTYGDGEPPDNAKALHTALHAAATASPANPSLSSLRFSVCSLGDTNYTQFCKCGADFDTFLEKLGAIRTAPRVDCDLDYETKFSGWLNAALAAITTDGARAPSNQSAPVASVVSEAAAPSTGPSRANPFSARVLTSRNLNAPASAKQVHHLEFDLADSGLAYEAGDALGVYPHNCPTLVDEVLAAIGCDGEEAVPAPDGTATSLRRALSECYDLGKPTPELLAMSFDFVGGALRPDASATANLSGHKAPPTVETAHFHHVIDVLLAAPAARPAPLDFVRALKKLQPRLYSISSSPRAHAGQVHLTVGAVRYDLHGRARKGVCSTFLAERVVAGESRVGVFVHTNASFRPPTSGDTPMIMVGPGTGIAPFRAFLHERKVAGARGRNWLFFGDQHAASDFLYRDELATLMQDGVLTRLDTAFSRDQADKLYVQHRMLEHAAEFFAWLEAGAHFYVCGDASRMAKDVDAALHTVIERGGHKTREQAVTYVQALKAAKRYARDVY